MKKTKSLREYQREYRLKNLVQTNVKSNVPEGYLLGKDAASILGLSRQGVNYLKNKGKLRFKIIGMNTACYDQLDVIKYRILREKRNGHRKNS